MRICFIADSSSIHVRRIVSYFVGQKDDVLILSSSTCIADIPNAKTIYLLDVKSAPANRSSMGKRDNQFIRYLKSFVSDSLKSFIQSTVKNMCLLSKRVICVDAIERFNPEVIYCFRSFPEGAVGSYSHVRPLLLRTAGPDISLFPKYPVYRQLTRRALMAADVVVTESHWERQLLQKLCRRGVNPEVGVIGIDTSIFRPATSRSALRQRYNLPTDAFVVVTNRYLDGWYNGWLVVEAIRTILEKCPNLILVYVTPLAISPRMRPKVHSVMLDSPRVKFLEGPLGHPEVAKILACGDLYVSFASFDGIPNSLLEAMACGLVPITADLPQLHEWIDHGRSGYFVPQYDTKALATIVNSLYNNREPLSAMSARCISKIREQASHDACMERTRDLLKLISSDSGRTRIINNQPDSVFHEKLAED